MASLTSQSARPLGLISPVLQKRTERGTRRPPNFSASSWSEYHLSCAMWDSKLWLGVDCILELGCHGVVAAVCHQLWPFPQTQSWGLTCMPIAGMSGYVGCWTQQNWQSSAMRCKSVQSQRSHQLHVPSARRHVDSLSDTAHHAESDRRDQRQLQRGGRLGVGPTSGVAGPTGFLSFARCRHGGVFRN